MNSPEAEKIMEEWFVSHPDVLAVIAYGSRRADLDYFLWYKKPVNPAEAFRSKERVSLTHKFGCLISHPALFDIAMRPWPCVPHIMRRTVDMMRNSPTSRPVKEHPEITVALQKLIAEFPERARMTDREILGAVKRLYVNWHFVHAKRDANPLHVRYLVAHILEPAILELARQLDLRRGGKGNWKARDYETTFLGSDLLFLRLELDPVGIASIPDRVRYFLAELKIPIPPRVQKWS